MQSRLSSSNRLDMASKRVNIVISSFFINFGNEDFYAFTRPILTVGATELRLHFTLRIFKDDQFGFFKSSLAFLEAEILLLIEGVSKLYS